MMVIVIIKRIVLLFLLFFCREDSVSESSSNNGHGSVMTVCDSAIKINKEFSNFYMGTTMNSLHDILQKKKNNILSLIQSREIPFSATLSRR